MTNTRRTINKSKNTAKLEVRDLLETVFAAELLKPSKTLWVVAPWISDIAIFDNSAGKFSMFPDYLMRKVPLSAVLHEIASRGSQIVVVISDDHPNEGFKDAIKRRFQESGILDRLTIVVESVQELHEKAITGEDYVISGSMNFTKNGIDFKTEKIVFSMDEVEVADSQFHCATRYGEGTH